MKFQTSIMLDSILNVIANLAESDEKKKEMLVEAFEGSMAHMDCGHEVCESVGLIIAQYIENEDWQGLQIFLKYDHEDLNGGIEK